MRFGRSVLRSVLLSARGGFCYTTGGMSAARRHPVIEAFQGVGSMALLATHGDAIAGTLQSVETSATLLWESLADRCMGRGTAGRLRADGQMASNVTHIAANVSLTTSNLNRLGLWRMLWKPKPAETNHPAAATAPGPKNPFR